MHKITAREFFKLSFVFSFKNEEENIVELTSRISKVLKRENVSDYELIFVNDASTDGSVQILQKLQKKYPGIFYFYLAPD